MEIAHALAMLGGDRDRRTEAQRKELTHRAGAALFRFVRGQDHGLADTVEEMCEVAILRQHTGAGIDQEENHIGAL